MGRLKACLHVERENDCGQRGQVHFLTICEAKSPPLAGFLFALAERISRSAAAPYPASA